MESESRLKRLSESQKKFYLEAAKQYSTARSGSPVEDYLAGRGISPDATTNFGLGYVADPLPGHEHFAGWLAIPYLRRSADGTPSVVSIRFRCIENHDHEHHGKYMTMAGDQPWLYNTSALSEKSDFVAVAEGELDTVAAAQCGIPTIGVPGVETWQPYFDRLLEGYQTVYVFGDGDDPGRVFANKVARRLDNGRPLLFTDGHDVNSFVLQEGSEALRHKMGLT